MISPVPCGSRVNGYIFVRVCTEQTLTIARRNFVAQGSALLSAAGLKLPVWSVLLCRSSNGASSGERPLLLGVDYYPDQTPEHLWEEDARLIAEAGPSNVGGGEFHGAVKGPGRGKVGFRRVVRGP